MKTFVRITLLLLIGLFSLPAFADDDNCKILGSWMGQDTYGWSWQLQFNGPNASGGTNILKMVEFNITLSGLFPDAVGPIHSPGGIWRRIDGDTYDVMGTLFVGDAIGNTLYVVKVTAQDTIEDCDWLFVQNTTIQFFGPFDDIYEDEPWLTLTPSDHYLQRVVFDTP